MVTGQRLLGPIDWYMEGAYILIRAQAVEGTWGSGQDAVVSQCFALLFLKRAFIPVATVSNAKPDPAKPVGQPATSSEGKPREME
jgi:hypothetical protein